MRRENLLFRLTAAAAITGLTMTAFPPVARAQQEDVASPEEVNPPARVGALTRVRGEVSFHAAGADSWSPAAINYPVTAGEGFWTQPEARARIDISDTDVVLAGGTEIEIGELDATSLVATLAQGEAYVRVLDVAQGETYTLITPRGAVTIGTAGRYAVLSGDTQTPTRITVLEGAASLSQGASGDLATGQAAEITGDAAPFQVQIVPAGRDAFITHALSEERPVPTQAVAPPALVAQMPGGAELAEYGTWTPSSQYGQVWYPQVASSWVPYREGHWAYVAPWGWTWVDSDAWGFAPFHYGRWIDDGGRWGWIPGYDQPVAEGPDYPVYAPALVTFFGVGLALGVTAARLDRGSVGWVPLSPDEAYRPWFRAGPQYVRDVNIRQVRDLTRITSITNNRGTVNNVTINHYRNVSGATVVPAAAMATSRPIAAVARRPSAEVLAQAHPVIGRAVVPPTTHTVGVTATNARAFHAIAAPTGSPTPRPAPGPAIRAQNLAPRSVGEPAGARHFAPPPLVTRGAPGVLPTTTREAGARPLAAAPAVRNAGRPSMAVPVLRAPGATPPEHPIQAETRPRAPEVGRAPGAPALTEHPGTPRIGTPSRPTPPARPEIRAPARPTEPAVRRPEPTAHPAPTVHQPAAPRPEARPAPAFHPAPAPRPEARPAPAFHPAPAPRPEARPAPAFHPAPAPRPEARPAPAFHPAPAPRPEARPAPAFHPAPAPRPAARPAPHEEKRPG